jgi:hypothetical protein
MGAPRLYTLNENYFENIDTEDKAYWLGFIYADGFITKRKLGFGQNILGITLHEKEPLEKFCIDIGTNKPVKEYKTVSKYAPKGSTEYKIAIISNKIVSDIEKWGVVERKTFELSSIPDISKELIPHFVRGYFDGDGSVFLHKSRGGYGGTKMYYYNILGITICGTFNFLNSIKEELLFLNEESKCLYKEKRNVKDVWSLKLLSNKRCREFYEYIYPDTTVNFLKRKRDVFENYFKLYTEGKHKKPVD